MSVSTIRQHAHRVAAYVSHHGFVVSHIAYLAIIAHDFNGVRSITELLVVLAVVCEHIAAE